MKPHLGNGFGPSSTGKILSRVQQKITETVRKTFRGMDHMPYQRRLEHKLCSEMNRARIRDGRHKLQQRKFQLDIRKK